MVNKLFFIRSIQHFNIVHSMEYTAKISTNSGIRIDLNQEMQWMEENFRTNEFLDMWKQQN